MSLGYQAGGQVFRTCCISMHVQEGQRRVHVHAVVCAHLPCVVRACACSCCFCLCAIIVFTRLRSQPMGNSNAHAAAVGLEGQANRNES